MQPPLLSVTVLNYNYGRYLPECLDSILTQTMRDFELILIDDCSTDGSLDVIQPYLADGRVRLVRHAKNKGYVSSLLEGVAQSRGSYITVVSADDFALCAKAFDAACAMLNEDPAVVFVYSAWHEMTDSHQIRHTRHAANRSYVAEGLDEFQRLLHASPVLHSGTVLRRSAYDRVGGYDPRCRYSVDTNMWLALCSQGKVAYLDHPYYAYRSHATNLSNSVGSLWRATEEMLLGIDYAFSLFPADVLPNRKPLRRRAMQTALVAIPTIDIFAGRLRRGWLGYFRALRHHPMLTVLQIRSALLVLRTALGARRYEWLQTAVDRQNYRD